MNIDAILLGAKALVAVINVAANVVEAVEQAVPQAGMGATKLDMSKAVLKGVYHGVAKAEADFDVVWPYVKEFIDGLVALWNTKGWFVRLTVSGDAPDAPQSAPGMLHELAGPA